MVGSKSKSIRFASVATAFALYIAPMFSWPLIGLEPRVAEARLTPINFIKRQIHKPNMLVVLDTSGSMTGVPGGAFSSSTEVGVDCDNGLSCRGWGATGLCSSSKRPCSSDVDCVPAYCTIGLGACTNQVGGAGGGATDDCPQYGSCAVGSQPCGADNDCAAYGWGTCGSSKVACNAKTPCPTTGICGKTNDPCTKIGQKCPVGACQNDPGKKCALSADCPVSAVGVCQGGGTPAGGCTTDTNCPSIGTCSTGESCKTTSDCPAITVGTCRNEPAISCTRNRTCETRRYPRGTCQFPRTNCTTTTGKCLINTAACVFDAANMCSVVPNTCVPAANGCVIPIPNKCNPAPAESCVAQAVPPSGALKMCQIKQTLCATDVDCTAPGDRCGPPTSRAVVAKRTLGRVIGNNYGLVNLGMMTFYQSGYFPYYSVTGGTMGKEQVLLTETQLGSLCYSAKTGPTKTCKYHGERFDLIVGDNSLYQINDGSGAIAPKDAAWCGDSCTIPGAGTGDYAGSYYQRDLIVGGTMSTTATVRPDYDGKFATFADSSGTVRNHRYYDSNPNYYNGGSKPPIATVNCGSACSATCGARWDDQLSTFLKPDATDDEAQSSAARMLDWMQKASYGGLTFYNSTPSGCVLENNVATNKNSSAYHYMDAVKTSDPLSCRQNYVLFITDGEANGPGDSNCTSAACSAANPQAAGCTCKVVLSASHMYRNLGVRTFVVGFSSDIISGNSRIINDNVARAGGTDYQFDGKAPYAYVATNETELEDAIQDAIYEAVKGTYSTAPSTTSSGTQLSNSVQAGKYALDARVDFPSWEGHLLAWDVSTTPPKLAWDANEELKQMPWWKRRIYIGTHQNSVVKVLVDANSKAITNARVINDLGIGVDDAEADRIIRFAMGDPAMKNPAVLGGFINSTPIDVGQPGSSPMPGGKAFFNTYKDRPNLTYVGSDDGMLHAFFTNPATIDGVDFVPGQEAFAYIPPSMIPVITKLYAQGGQKANPSDHVFGLANSPKVKNLCVSNCTDAQSAIWKTMLVMNDGYGGGSIFMLDITNPLSATGFAEPPVIPIWHSSDPNIQQSYDDNLGYSISVPAFFFDKTPSLDHYGLIFASGYQRDSNASAQGRRLVVAEAKTGVIIDTLNSFTSGSCSQEYGVLADVATAKDYTAAEDGKLRAAFVGDTWGGLWRYKFNGGMTNILSTGCDQPLHFAPTVVQLDRDDPTNRPGETYLVQVTNSALDDDTAKLAPSKMIIMKQYADANHDAATDTNFGQGGKIELSVANKADICAVTNADGSCKDALPSIARPTATPMAILKKDGTGFQMLTMWYAQDISGCSKGTTWLTIHEVIGTSVKQKQGLKVADEPVTSPVIAGGKIFIVGANGTVEIGSKLESTFSTGTSSPLADYGSGNYRVLGWVELEE